MHPSAFRWMIALTLAGVGCNGIGASEGSEADPDASFASQFVGVLDRAAEHCVVGAYHAACADEVCITLYQALESRELLAGYLRNPWQLLEPLADQAGLGGELPCTTAKEMLASDDASWALVQASRGWVCTAHVEPGTALTPTHRGEASELCAHTAAQHQVAWPLVAARGE